MAKFKPTKLFLTSFPNGERRPVEVIQEHENRKGYFYIRFVNGGTDTTCDEWLFDLPAMLEITDTKAESVDYSFNAVNDLVHGADVEFEELQGLCLGMASEIERIKSQQCKQCDTPPNHLGLFSVLE